MRAPGPAPLTEGPRPPRTSPPRTLLSPGNVVAAYRKTHLCDVELAGRVVMKESSFTNPGTEIVPPVGTPAGRVRDGWAPPGTFGVPVGRGAPLARALRPLRCPLTSAQSPPGPGAVPSLTSPPCPRQLGLSICYDLRFPEISLALRRAGAEILTYPSAFTIPTGSAHWEVSSAPGPPAAPASPSAPRPHPGGSRRSSPVPRGGCRAGAEPSPQSPPAASKQGRILQPRGANLRQKASFLGI